MAEFNDQYFGGDLPESPIVVGGRVRHSLLTNSIVLPRNVFGPLRRADDAIVHQMAHVRLSLSGRLTAHNTNDWCSLIIELSPAVLGIEILAEPVREESRVKPGYLTRQQLAGWPASLRPAGFYDNDGGITGGYPRPDWSARKRAEAAEDLYQQRLRSLPGVLKAQPRAAGE